MTEQEQWQPTVGYAGYRISNHGRVWSEFNHKFIRIKVDKRGYRVVQIRQDGISRSVFVHRLIATAFSEGRAPGLEVRHLDGDPGNNAPANLAWGTHTENMQDMMRHGRSPGANKTHCPQGHAYTPENTYLSTLPSGGRGKKCRECGRIDTRARSGRAYRAERDAELASLVADPTDVKALQDALLRHNGWLERVRLLALEMDLDAESRVLASRLREAISDVDAYQVDHGAAATECPECGLSMRRDTLRRHMRRRHQIRAGIPS